MTALIRAFLLATVAGLLLIASNPTPAHADDYWDNHWSWYDGTYQPYYYRHYDYYGPSYYGPSYGYPYGQAYPYSGYYYGSPGYRYRGDYYGTPNFGYRDFRGGGGQVRVGPMRFGWR
jgi:hypothetical protein